MILATKSFVFIYTILASNRVANLGILEADLPFSAKIVIMLMKTIEEDRNS